MESLLLLIPLTALVMVGAAAVFWWAVDDGQFEDVERQGRRSLFDEADAPRDPTAASRDRSA
jgi:cbb3-type cytochrome oxidase maturation protein